MAYVLVPQNGDSTAVPQIVMAHVARADGDTVRVALHILATGDTDPRSLAKTLGLKSIEAAKRALQYWAGAGLLRKERGLPPAAEKTEAEKAAAIDLAALDDPYVAFLCDEAQATLGRALDRSELQRLVGLYLNDGWKPDVVLLACSEAVRRGRRTVASVARELTRWREAGVETGEDAERYLDRQARCEAHCAEAAALFALAPDALTRWERDAIARWYEDWHFDAPMIEEALLHAEGKRTVRYVDGILRRWHAQGLTTVDAVRGQGQLAGSNILATTGRPGKPSTPAAQGNWNAMLDKELEGLSDAYEG